jgi:hypothetical protein
VAFEQQKLKATTITVLQIKNDKKCAFYAHIEVKGCVGPRHSLGG